MLLLVSTGSQAATVTTPGIIAQTTAATFACMRWMPVGVCFWLRCSWTGCRVRTSLKVGHYNPDLVVSVYNELGGNPWAEIRATLGLAQRAAATGLLGALPLLAVHHFLSRMRERWLTRLERCLALLEVERPGSQPVPARGGSDEA
jgi:hypothetical protein